MRLTSGVAIALIACALTEPTRAGVIRGTLHVPRPAEPLTAANPYPGRADALPGAAGVTRGQVGDAVVYVETVPAAAESALAAAAPPPPSLAQRQQTFVPRVVAVAAGSTVAFPNLDPIYHNVFSLSPARRFDLGKYPKGQSREVRFAKPGLVNVYCDIHSGMEAFVLVLPHHGFARPDADGAFALPDLPAGRYRLVAWHPDLGTRGASVEVPELGTVAVDLGL